MKAIVNSSLTKVFHTLVDSTGRCEYVATVELLECLPMEIIDDDLKIDTILDEAMDKINLVLEWL